MGFRGRGDIALSRKPAREVLTRVAFTERASAVRGTVSPFRDRRRSVLKRFPQPPHSRYYHCRARDQPPSASGARSPVPGPSALWFDRPAARHILPPTDSRLICNTHPRLYEMEDSNRLGVKVREIVDSIVAMSWLCIRLWEGCNAPLRVFGLITEAASCSCRDGNWSENADSKKLKHSNC